MADSEELKSLDRRIADVRHAIEQARKQYRWPGNVSERDSILALLNRTLKALEARKTALQSDNQ
jgi:hypothetical protein